MCIITQFARQSFGLLVADCGMHNIDFVPHNADAGTFDKRKTN